MRKGFLVFSIYSMVKEMARFINFAFVTDIFGLGERNGLELARSALCLTTARRSVCGAGRCDWQLETVLGALYCANSIAVAYQESSLFPVEHPQPNPLTSVGSLRPTCHSPSHRCTSQTTVYQAASAPKTLRHHYW